MCTGGSTAGCGLYAGAVLQDVYVGQSCRMCTLGSPAGCVRWAVLQDVGCVQGQSYSFVSLYLYRHISACLRISLC